VNSAKTIRVSKEVYEKIRQDLEDHEVADDVLRRMLRMEPRARRRYSLGPKELFLKIRGQYIVASLNRRRGGVRYKLPLAKDSMQENAILRTKIIAYATRNCVSERAIAGIARFFRTNGYFLRRTNRIGLL
jgi:negative regulator of replication initiation